MQRLRLRSSHNHPANASTHTVFQANSHHGRHQAPVVVSTTSLAPKASSTATPIARHAVQPCRAVSEIEIATAMPIQRHASRRLRRTNVGSTLG